MRSFVKLSRQRVFTICFIVWVLVMPVIFFMNGLLTEEKLENEALLSALMYDNRDQQQRSANATRETKLEEWMLRLEKRRSADAIAKKKIEEYRLRAENDSVLRSTASHNLIYNSSMTRENHGWTVVRPRFEIGTGDVKYLNRYKRNTDGLLQKVEEAVDAGCMRNWMHPQTIFILFVDISKLDIFFQRRYELIIWYQTQQLSSNVGLPRSFAYVMRSVDQMWHYSHMSIQGLGEKYNYSLATAEKDGRYYYVPLWTSLHESFLHNQVSETWKFDVLVFGKVNKRTNPIFSQLRMMKLRALWNEDWKHFEQWLKQSRLLLNVHYTSEPVALEVHLINPALAQGLIVVSEESADKELDEIYAPVVTFAPFDELVQTVEKTLSQPEAELAAKRKFNREWMRERSQGVDPNLCFALSRLVKTANKKLLNV